MRRLRSQRYALRSRPHCPGAAGPGQEASPPHQKATKGGGTGGWKWAGGVGGGGKVSRSQEQPRSQHPRLPVLASQPFAALKSVFAPLLPLLWAMGHHGYGMHKILVLRSVYLGFAKTCSRIQMLCTWVIKSLIYSLNFQKARTA